MTLGTRARKREWVAGGDAPGHPASKGGPEAAAAARKLVRVNVPVARPMVHPPVPVVAAVLLVASLLFPYWTITLYAPQYPGGLRASVYLTHVKGDADEISNLNHYIGMKALDEAAPLERSVAVPTVLLFALGLALSAWVRRFRVLLRLPAIAFPAAVVADIAYWLWRFGHSLDPAAPIRLEPFMPVILGRGEIAQFATVAMFGPGFFLALAAAGLAIYDLVRDRRSSPRAVTAVPRIGGGGR
ncbi:MAG: cytochrome C [Armatimonadota bacterium]|nr:cytochrome C [Armatimonadota bacterium]